MEPEIKTEVKEVKKIPSSLQEIVFYDPTKDALPGGQGASLRVIRARPSVVNKKQIIGTDSITVRGGLNLMTREDIDYLREERSNFEQIIRILPRLEKYKYDPIVPNLDCYGKDIVNYILANFASSSQDTLTLMEILKIKVTDADYRDKLTARIKFLKDAIRTSEDRPKDVATVLGQLYGQNQGIFTV